ncbi:hypothetical protein Tco_0123185 [Tanacetum coccineum]
MKSSNSEINISENENDLLSFFDNTGPQSPNDEGRTSSVKDGSSPLPRSRTTDNSHLYQEEVSTTQFDDQSLSEGNNENNDVSVSTQTENEFDQDSGVQTPGVRRSSRPTKMPARFNDYVVSSNAKYGIEKYVKYSCLSRSNLCFATTLNKSVEPTSYYEALKDNN